MKNEQIDTYLGYLAEIGAFLSKIKHVESLNTNVSEAVERYLDGFNFSPLGGESLAPMRNVSAALQVNKENKNGISEIFNKKELKDMPKLKDFKYRYKEKDGIHEFRYRRNGIIRSFSSKILSEAKHKAIVFCRELNFSEATYSNRTVTFNEYAIEYMENVKKRNVSAKTYHNDYNRFSNHILPYFNGYALKEISAPLIQRFLNVYVDKKLFRTAEALYFILKQIFDYASNNDVINKSPMRAVKIPSHVREVGKALTLEVEKHFVASIAGTTYELTFATLLYTGCRPCELESITFEKDGFVTVRNRKQKNNVVVYKDIPITPKYRPYAERAKNELPLKNTSELGKIFAKLCKGYRLYDLRHTFATRCQTCGVPQEIVGRWLGHKSDKITDNTYTHFPPDFMLKMGKMVDY